MIDDIYTRTPINKTASLVTSQHGCVDKQSLSDMRESLILAKESLQKQFDSLPKYDHKRRAVGDQIRSICQDLALIRKQKKFVGQRDRDLDSYILDVVKESVPAYKFKEWLSMARARKELDISGGQK